MNSTSQSNGQFHGVLRLEDLPEIIRPFVLEIATELPELVIYEDTNVRNSSRNHWVYSVVARRELHNSQVPSASLQEDAGDNQS